MSRRNLTIIDRFGGRHGTQCGYCKHSSKRHSHGMWAHSMTASDYQDLIDRGWRRSGQYCYKPNNKVTCCPSYTIKCDAQEFRLSKSHKKILKKMNGFLRSGQKSGNGGGAGNKTANAHDDSQGADIDDGDVKMDAEQPNESSALTECKLITSNQPKVSIDIDNVLEMIKKSENGSKPSESSATVVKTDTQPINNDTGTSCNSKKSVESNKRGIVAGPDPTKPLQPKAKLLRQQRKSEKLAKQANTSTDAPTNQSPQLVTPKTAQKNLEKNLKALIDDTPTDAQYKLKVKLVPSSSASTEAALEVYRRYQIGIHKDPPEKITRKNFENFLIRSPLQLTVVSVESDAFQSSKHTEYDLYTKYQTKIHHDPPSDITEFIDFLCNSPIKLETPDDGPSCGYGSFHQQYWLNDTLIAVGVIDILPKCVSSVYFFYDPEYSFLTLGTYGTLREIQFIQELNEKCPQLKEYYMGFYIHSCPKMRYKGRLQPSYLLCPEVYSWHLLSDDILKLLDQSKYSRFNTDLQAKDLNEFNPATDLNNLRLLVDYKYCLTYKDYKEYKGTTDGTDSDDDDYDNFTEYGKLVGKILSRRLYLVT